MSPKLNMSTEGSDGIFHTIQAEGKLVGYPSVFARTSGCNLRCTWSNPDGSTTACDTPHTSFDPDKNLQDVESLIHRISAFDCDHVVITGGEPFMQKSVVELINGLHALGHHVTVETNGTIYRETSADLLSLSVKLSSSAAHPDLGKRHEAQRLKYDQLVNFITYSRDYQFKFVINTEEDVVEILGIKDVLLRETNEDITSRIWVMPQGICSQQLDSKMLMLVAICKEHGWKLSDRMQLRIWGHMKGV